MRIRYVTSACVVIEHQGLRVLCDPWLTDGIYYGSWFHYPPLQCVPEDFADVDYLYLSHVHPDHLDVESLKRLPRTIPVLILDYAEKFVRRSLIELGFERVLEVPHGGTVSLGADFAIQLFAADNCDPALCGRFFGCGIPQPYRQTLQIDSLAVVRGGGKRIVNVNDCPYELTKSLCDTLVRAEGSIDLLLVGYSGAGEYPQCFDHLDDAAKLEKAHAKRAQFIEQAARYIAHLRPTAVMPFAGRYTLGGRLASLNRFRGVPELEEVPAELEPRLKARGVSVSMVLLNADEWFDVDTGTMSAPFIPPDPVARVRYIEDVLSKKRFLYEEDRCVDEAEQVDLASRLEQAHGRMRTHLHQYGYRSAWRVYLDIGQRDLYGIPFDDGRVERVERGAEREPFVRISLDPALLRMILTRAAHWNNAAIGSHLRFVRQPDVFERGVYHFLSYFHC